MRKANKHRAARGNMIVLIGAILVGIVMLVIAFSFNFARLLGGQQGQQTAIQAAALAAAQDIGKIVVNTPDFGWVSLSDDAPIGSKTVAVDQYFLPVRSVNTIVATARVDYLIGQKLGDTVMMGLAQQDFNNLKNNALPQLEKAIGAAIATPTGTGKDINNNDVTPYADAEQAFKDNLKKYESGTNCQYVAGSLKLNIGCLTQGVATNIKPPTSGGALQANSSQQLNGFYLSDTDLTVGPVPFALGAIGSSCRLVDQTKYSAKPVTTFGIPAVIKAEADQTVTNSQKANMTVHATACAQPASVYDPRPAPGAFVVSFPDGQPPPIVTLGDCFRLLTGNAKILSPNGGDYPDDCPPTLMQSMPWMLAGSPQMNDAVDAGFFDWVRRAGTKADMDSIIAMMGKTFTTSTAVKDWKTELVLKGAIIDLSATHGVSNPQIPVGTMHIWKFDTNGVPQYKFVSGVTPYNYCVEAQNQMYAEQLDALTGGPTSVFTGLNAVIKAITSSSAKIILTNKWDAYLRDECRWPGTIKGGKHAGEPLNNPVVAWQRSKDRRICLDTTKNTALLGDCGRSGIGGKPPQTGNPSSTGSIPILGNQSDFNEMMQDIDSFYIEYAVGPAPTSGVRPTYQTNGTCTEIRFRRQCKIDATVLDAISGAYNIGDTGYLSAEF